MGSQTIGERIKLRRQELGLTLDDIANEIGVARSTVQRYEKDSIEKVKLPVIEAMARVMHVNPAWLCCKSETMHLNDAQGPTPVFESGPPDPLTVRLNELLAQATEETKQAMIVLLEQSQKP